jgi:hypothetical protein
MSPCDSQQVSYKRQPARWFRRAKVEDGTIQLRESAGWRLYGRRIFRIDSSEHLDTDPALIGMTHRVTERCERDALSYIVFRTRCRHKGVYQMGESHEGPCKFERPRLYTERTGDPELLIKL